MQNTKRINGTGIYICDDYSYKEKELKRKMENIEKSNENAKIKIGKKKVYRCVVYLEWSQIKLSALLLQ